MVAKSKVNVKATSKKKPVSEIKEEKRAKVFDDFLKKFPADEVGFWQIAGYDSYRASDSFVVRGRYEDVVNFAFSKAKFAKWQSDYYSKYSKWIVGTIEKFSFIDLTDPDFLNKIEEARKQKLEIDKQMKEL